MPDDEEVEPWWKQYGIDPTEITASVDAALVGPAIVHECTEDASAAILRSLVKRVRPLMKGRPQSEQAELGAAVAVIY